MGDGPGLRAVEYVYVDTDGERLGDAVLFTGLGARGRVDRGLEAWRGTYSFDVGPPPLTLTANVDFPTPAGNQITWTATLGATGAAAVEYQFQVTDTATNTTTVLRNYSSSNQAQWVPLSAGRFHRAGSRTSGGQPHTCNTSRARRPSTSRQRRSRLPRSQLRRLSRPSTGKPITWTARVQGGMAGPIQYQFWLYSSATGWRNAQPYGPSETFTWTPASTDAGDYALQVWVRSNGSTAAYEAYAGTGIFHIFPGVQLTTSTLFPVAVGTTTTWTADVSIRA